MNSSNSHTHQNWLWISQTRSGPDLLPAQLASVSSSWITPYLHISRPFRRAISTWAWVAMFACRALHASLATEALKLYWLFSVTMNTPDIVFLVVTEKRKHFIRNGVCCMYTTYYCRDNSNDFRNVTLCTSFLIWIWIKITQILKEEEKKETFVPWTCERSNASAQKAPAHSRRHEVVQCLAMLPLTAGLSGVLGRRTTFCRCSMLEKALSWWQTIPWESENRKDRMDCAKAFDSGLRLGPEHELCGPHWLCQL